MKTILSSWRHHYLPRVSIFLVTIALIAGMVGCVPSYDLTVSSTAGGSVTTPGEGVFTYDEGTVVDLVAEPEEGYLFVNWTGDVDTIDDVNAAATNITIYHSSSIRANFALFAGGNGTKGDPYQIVDWSQLDNVRNYLDSYFILINNLDSTTAGYTELASPTANQGIGWQPIGSDQFTGTFDGQGYEISDLYINRPSEYDLGLFGVVGLDGVIKNIGVVNASMTGEGHLGGVVGLSYGTVISSYCSGNVTGDWMIAGLVGHNWGGTVTNSYSTSSVSGNAWVGGLVGENREGTVSDSYSSGNVAGENFSTGGLVGRNQGGNVTNSYSTGIVSGNTYVGGLVGDNLDGTVSDSYSSANVMGIVCVGGLVGGIAWGGTVSNSYSTGNVTGTDSAGGLVGYSEGTVSNSFWDTETSGQATSDGGTGKTTAEMQDIATFTGAAWDIVAVANPSTRILARIWNIVKDETYPFLSWQP